MGCVAVPSDPGVLCELLYCVSCVVCELCCMRAVLCVSCCIV